MFQRLASTGLIISLALGATACSKRGSAISQLSGAEAQRISFGDPQTTQASFYEKISSCWFGGRQPLLYGYRFDAKPVFTSSVVEPKADAPSSIRVYPENANPTRGDQGFEVQFHAYNKNTLISTRNYSLPPELANKLKYDIETWILGRRDCGDGAPPPLEPAPPPPRLNAQSA